MPKKNLKDEDTSAKKRNRSLDHLQTLYTVIIGLSIVEGIKSLLILDIEIESASLFSMVINYEAIPTFLTLIFTIIPFHHGAKRYLDDTYIFREINEIPLTGLIDFIVFFVEAIVFFIMASLIPIPKYFFLMLIFLLTIDIVWVGFVYFTSNYSFQKIKFWLYANLTYAIVLPIFIYGNFILNESITWSLLAVFSFIRTVCDYKFSWSFYWPSAS